MPAFLVEAGSGPGCPGSDWQRLSPLNATEGILSALLGLNFKVKGTSGGGTTGKVDKGDRSYLEHSWASGQKGKKYMTNHTLSSA